MKKNFLLISLFATFLLLSPKVFAVNEACSTAAPCCNPPPSIIDGGGCSSGQFWIGPALGGSCQTPVTCPTSQRFSCASNACITIGSSSCSTSNVDTGRNAACCLNGQVPVRLDTGWVCSPLDDTNVQKAHLSNLGVLRFSWDDTEIADDITISDAGQVKIGALPTGPIYDGDWKHIANNDQIYDFLLSLSNPWSVDKEITYKNSGKVGIGTVRPDVDLHVVGGVSISSDKTGLEKPYSRLHLAGKQAPVITLENASNSVGYIASGGDRNELIIASGQSIHFKTEVDFEKGPLLSGSSRMYIMENGDVGIGTKPFHERLTVRINEDPSSNDLYGIHAYARNSSDTHTKKIYGLYAEAITPSSLCPGGIEGCAEAFGVYSTTGPTVFGTGVYGEGRHVGIHAVGLNTKGTPSTALLVEGRGDRVTASDFKCSGKNCTSAVFWNGDDAGLNSNNGYIIIGDPEVEQISIDDNEIMAKADAETPAPLYLNNDGSFVRIGGGGGDGELRVKSKEGRELVLEADDAGNFAHLGTRSNHALKFVTNDRIRMSLTTAGKLGIGDESPDYTLDVAGNIGGTSQFHAASDERFKKNIESIDSALATVLNLNGVVFEWRDDEFPSKRFSEGQQLGFIAQDIENVLPQVVHTNDEGYKSVTYSSVIPVLVEAIKEQQELIDELRRELGLLK